MKMQEDEKDFGSCYRSSIFFNTLPFFDACASIDSYSGAGFSGDHN